MNWLKQRYTSLAYRHTLQRIDFIINYSKIHGFGESIQSRLAQELESLSKLTHGSGERKDVHKAYEDKMNQEVDKRHKKEGS